MIVCCDPCVPTHGIRTMLNPTAPKIAPTVFAAYTSPTSAPLSCSLVAADASANGKLNPHSSAGGRIANRHIIKSTRNSRQGFVTARGLNGHDGIISDTAYAVH